MHHMRKLRMSERMILWGKRSHSSNRATSSSLVLDRAGFGCWICLCRTPHTCLIKLRSNAYSVWPGVIIHQNEFCTYVPGKWSHSGWRISSLYLIPVSAPFLMMYNSMDPWVRRLEFARDHADWQILHLRPVLFTDESKFCVDFNNGRRRVWRQRDERFSYRCVAQHDRFRGGSVMVLGAFLFKLYIIWNGALTGINMRFFTHCEIICRGHSCRIRFDGW
jgi:hypothetical protein